MNIKSLQIKDSDIKDKKYTAIFTLEDGKKKTVHFGAKGYEDFTMHKDESRKENYITRHSKNEDWDDPFTPGALSRYILWNKPSLHDSIQDFKKRFSIKDKK